MTDAVRVARVSVQLNEAILQRLMQILKETRYRTGTASPAKNDMGAVSSESLGHPCRCRFLHHRNLDSRESGYVLRLVRDSAEDPPGPYLDTHTQPGPSLHETSSAPPCRVRRQLSPRLLAPHHRPRLKYTTEFREVLKKTTWTLSRFRQDLRTAILTRSVSCARSKRSA